MLIFVDWVWNVMAHAQKSYFVFRRSGRVHLNRRGRQFNRLLAAEVCASAVVMLDTPCSDVVWRVLATHFIRQFLLHFPSRASPCAITFQPDSTSWQPDQTDGSWQKYRWFDSIYRQLTVHFNKTTDRAKTVTIQEPNTWHANPLWPLSIRAVAHRTECGQMWWYI